MTPYVAGEVSKALKKAARSLLEYEFVPKSMGSDEEEEGKSEEEVTRPMISLKGIIFALLGEQQHK